jgi:hypothetical protein
MEAHGNPGLQTAFYGSGNDEGAIRLVWTEDSEGHGG